MKKQIVTLLALFIFSTPICAQSVGELVDKVNVLDRTLQNGISKADAVLSEQQRTLFINATNYTAYLKDNLKELTDDLDKKLDKQQRQIFNQVDSFITAIEGVQTGIRTDVQNLTLDVENAITRLPFTSKKPTPTYISIPTLTITQDKTIEIKIRGIKLDNERNYVVLNGKKYTDPVRPSEKENQYRIKLTKDDIFNPESQNILEIHLFKGNKPRKFTAYYSVVPQKIATVSIRYKVSSQDTKYSDHSEVVSSTPGGTSWKEVNRQINKRGGDGWRIDKNSIGVSKERGAEGGSSCSSSPNSTTDISFVAQANGKCKRRNPFDIVCGRTDCRFSWREYFINDQSTVETKTVDVNYREQKVIQLPENVESLVGTEVIFFDGTKHETIDSLFTKNFVRVKLNLINKVAEVAFIE